MKQRSYDSFWQKVHTQAKKDGVPLRVMFELTYRCNFKCRHCYVPPSYSSRYARLELDTKKVLDILGQLKEQGCFYLGFTGGEPLMRKDFLKILEAAKRMGFEVIVYTNGSLIDKETAIRLHHLGVNKIDITIPGMSRRVLEAVTGAPGSHRKVFKAIDRLQKYGVPLGFKTCLLKDNETEIGDIRRFVRSLKALHRLDTGLAARWDGSREPFLYRAQKLEDRREKIENRKNNSEFACGIGRTQAAITPAGELKCCVMVDAPKYNLLDLTFGRSWDQLKVWVRRNNRKLRLSCPERKA
jgi:MoaA/NifB/PqqE/SkfB family radical SAM enzyme